MVHQGRDRDRIQLPTRRASGRTPDRGRQPRAYAGVAPYSPGAGVPGRDGRPGGPDRVVRPENVYRAGDEAATGAGGPLPAGDVGRDLRRVQRGTGATGYRGRHRLHVNRQSQSGGAVSPADGVFPTDGAATGAAGMDRAGGNGAGAPLSLAPRGAGPFSTEAPAATGAVPNWLKVLGALLGAYMLWRLVK